MIKDKFKPDLLINELAELNLEVLKKEGIKCLILDVDNTFAPLKKSEKSAIAFLNEASRFHLKVHLFSNNFSFKIKPFADKYNLSYTPLAFKPFKYSYKRFFKKYGYYKSEVLAIGDQIFTDVLGAKRCGIKVVFLQKKHSSDHFLTKLLRPLERLILDE